MVRMGWVGMVLCALACTSVKIAQRDGCWVKRTERTFGGDHEELGFCARQQPQWAQDRLARLVQECMAQADYRWENRALAAWSRNEPLPAQESDAEITKTCMAQATQAMGIEAENEALKARVAELTKDRSEFKEISEKDRDYLKDSGEKMVTALGEAAKKPAPNATATATSTTKSESDQRSAAPAPGAPAVTVVGMPVPVTSPAAPVTSAPTAAPSPCATARAKTPHKAGDAPRCDKPVEAIPGSATTAAIAPKAG